MSGRLRLLASPTGDPRDLRSSPVLSDYLFIVYCLLPVRKDVVYKNKCCKLNFQNNSKTKRHSLT